MLALAVLACTPASAQHRSPTRRPAKDRGFIALNVGVQAGAGTFVDTFTYQVNAEEAMTQARYRSKTSWLVDVAGGLHVWKKKVGVAVAVTRSSLSAGADTVSRIPHPFFDNQDREVSGEAADLTRIETALHLQLYYLKASGKWRLLLGAGPSRFNLEQQVVTGIRVDETYPYDTATFDSVTTRRGKASGLGFNVGIDVSRMLSRSLAAGMLARYAKGTVDFNLDGSHPVSTDAGGLQLGAGIRLRF
ncbi:MAG: hypothetical protein ABIP65_09840 [Vicinamibacterales bacterium]